MCTLATANVYNIHGMPFTLRALIDQGSQSAMITKKAAQILSLPRNIINATISGVDKQKKYAKHSVRLTIKTRIASNFIMHTEAIIIEKMFSGAKINYDKNGWNHFSHLQMADPAFHEMHKIDVLLGAAEYAEIIRVGLVKGNVGTPTAQNTELGWIVSGAISTEATINMNATRKFEHKIASNSALIQHNQRANDTPDLVSGEDAHDDPKIILSIKAIEQAQLLKLTKITAPNKYGNAIHQLFLADEKTTDTHDPYNYGLFDALVFDIIFYFIIA